MPALRQRLAGRLLRWAIDAAILVGLVWGTVGFAFPSTDLALRPSENLVSFRGAAPAIGLEISPSTFTLHRGSNVSLSAGWSSRDPLCQVQPIWFRWSVDPDNATGYLNQSEGAGSTFFAASFVSGFATVRVQSAAVLSCPSNNSVVHQTAMSSIRVVVPLTVSVPEIGYDPLVPGQLTTLNGSVEGGEPPYAVEVRWGDGTNTTLAQADPGSFSVAHGFPVGSFAPSITVWDSEGDLASSIVAENVSVSYGLAVGIAPFDGWVDIGSTVDFVGLIHGPTESEVPLFACSNGTVSGGPNTTEAGHEVQFSCTFQSVGAAEVLFGEYPTQAGGPSATAILYERVAADPQVSGELPDAVATVGASIAAEVDVQGGSPPFELRWNASGLPGVGIESISESGAGMVAFTMAAPGDYPVWIEVIDSFGASATWNLTGITFEAGANGTAAGGSSVDPDAASVRVVGTVVSGCPPYEWWAIPSVSPANSTDTNGTLPAEGDFVWNGSFDREGNLSVFVGIVDLCGSVWQSTLQVVLVVPLSAHLDASVAATQGSPPSFEVNVTVNGGVPPFRLDVESAGNRSWNRSMAVDGAYQWTFRTNQSGVVWLQAAVTDSFDAVVLANLSLVLNFTSEGAIPGPVPRAPSSPNGDEPSGAADSASTVPDSGWLLLGAALAIGGTGLAFFLRKRRNRTGPPGDPLPDPETTLRGIIEPAEGAERFTVELLAEEAGVPLSTVRSTIDRLVQEGKVFAESGADGEEVLSWTGN